MSNTKTQTQQKRTKTQLKPIVVKNAYGNYGIAINGQIIGNFATYGDAQRIADMNK